jgi:hypothetical protein
VNPASCPVCGERARWSAEVSVILVFAPGLPRPYPLIASEGYRYCVGGGCDALLQMVRRAVDAHPVTRVAGQWSRAIVLHADGSGTNVVWKGGTELARA